MRGIGVAVGTGIGLAGYAFGVEPLYRLSVTTYRVTPRDWPAGLRVRLAIVADLHAHRYSMPLARSEEIVSVTNGLGAVAVMAPFPFPLIGYGAAPILGFALALGIAERLPPPPG